MPGRSLLGFYPQNYFQLLVSPPSEVWSRACSLSQGLRTGSLEYHPAATGSTFLWKPSRKESKKLLQVSLHAPVPRRTAVGCPSSWISEEGAVWRGTPWKEHLSSNSAASTECLLITFDKEPVVVQSLSRVQLFATQWTAACRASLSFPISWSLLKLMSIELMMSSNHLIFCHPLLRLPSIFPSIRIFPNELALCMSRPKYLSFSFSISPSNEYSGLISFWIDWFNLFVVKGTLKQFSPTRQFGNNDSLTLSLYSPTLTSIHDCWKNHQFRSVQSLSHVRLFVTPWITTCQAFLSITNSLSSLRLISIESVMPSNHLTLCHHLLFLPSILPSSRVFSNESALHLTWPKYWSFSFNISPTNEHPGLISSRIKRLDLLAV